MKKVLKIFFILSLLLNLFLLLVLSYYLYEDKIRKDYFSFAKYRELNKQVEQNSIRAVFIGNSITENWMNANPVFFTGNGFVCRGTGGESSSQLLLRFRQDVVELAPQVVVINAGTNDIGRGDGFYDEVFTLDNIKAMADIARANNIRVVLSSVLPAAEYRANKIKTIRGVEADIVLLNSKIECYASANGFAYIDYYKYLANNNGGFKKEYTFDGVHPNGKGYDVMEKLILTLLDNIDCKTG